LGGEEEAASSSATSLGLDTALVNARRSGGSEKKEKIGACADDSQVAPCSQPGIWHPSLSSTLLVPIFNTRKGFLVGLKCCKQKMLCQKKREDPKNLPFFLHATLHGTLYTTTPFFLQSCRYYQQN
jgi:hypothetical protein